MMRLNIANLLSKHTSTLTKYPDIKLGSTTVSPTWPDCFSEQGLIVCSISAHTNQGGTLPIPATHPHSGVLIDSSGVLIISTAHSIWCASTF